LFDAAVNIGTNIIPGIGGIMLFNVGPGVGHVDFSRFRAHVGKSVEDVCQFVDGKILGIVVAAVDCLEAPALVKFSFNV